MLQRKLALSKLNLSRFVKVDMLFPALETLKETYTITADTAYLWVRAVGALVPPYNCHVLSFFNKLTGFKVCAETPPLFDCWTFSGCRVALAVSIISSLFDV
ncbi:hypothetical protein GJ496_008926 [Pomphorhynchus laevis]|nr:hypothetical protein GJ496_008926 [Pomphorhynchus laevis]